MTSNNIQPPEQPPRREIRLAVLFTAMILLARLLLESANPELRDHDFSAMYTAGYMLLQGNGGRLYDLAEQARAQEATRDKRPGLMVIVHPPFEALLFAPLAGLSYRSAYLVWGALNISLWLLFAYTARPIAPVPQQTFQFMLLCFTFFPLWDTLLRGQTTLVLLVLYTLMYACLERRQEFRAGAFLGLGLFRFQLVLPFALLCALRQKWRIVAGFTAAAVVLGGLSIAVGGWSGAVSYISLLVRLIQHPVDVADNAILPADIAPVPGLLRAMGAGRLAPLWLNGAAAAVAGLLLLYTAVLWRRVDQGESAVSRSLLFAGALGVTLATAVPLHAYDLALLPLPMLLVIGSPEWSRNTFWRTLLIVSMAVLYLFPLHQLLNAWNRLYFLWPPLIAFLLGLLGLLRQTIQPRLGSRQPDLIPAVGSVGHSEVKPFGRGRNG